MTIPLDNPSPFPSADHQADPFGAAFEEAADALNETAAIDTLAESPEPPPASLDHAIRFRAGPGGKTDRPPPPADWLIGSRNPHARAQRRAGVNGFPAASDSACADWLRWIYYHRSRGLSPVDYAWQREWTTARALGFGFFVAAGVVSRTLDLPDAAAVAVFRGHRITLARRRFVAMLAIADRLGWNGLTLSGPEVAAIVGCSVSTAWDVIRWAELQGITFRLRRYKPGRGGKPVALTRNWYGIGPGLSNHRDLYAPRDDDGDGDGDGDGDADPMAAAVDAARGVIRRRRYRHRRARRRTLARRGAVVFRPAGRRMVDREQFAAEVIAGDEARAAVAAAVTVATSKARAVVAEQARAVVADGADIATALERVAAAREQAAAQVPAGPAEPLPAAVVAGARAELGEPGAPDPNDDDDDADRDRRRGGKCAKTGERPPPNTPSDFRMVRQASDTAQTRIGTGRVSPSTRRRSRSASSSSSFGSGAPGGRGENERAEPASGFRACVGPPSSHARAPSPAEPTGGAPPREDRNPIAAATGDPGHLGGSRRTDDDALAAAVADGNTFAALYLADVAARSR